MGSGKVIGPRLRHCTMLDSGTQDPLKLIVGRSHYELTELEGDRPTFLKLKSLMDGRHPPDEMARLTGLQRAQVDDVIRAFDALGLTRENTPVTQISGRELKAQLEETLEMWRQQIGYHRLFEGLAKGRYRIEVLQGLFIETYHFVRMATDHVGTALGRAATDAARYALSEYLHDEYRHAPLLLQTCVNLGCDADHVRESHPIVATTSLVHMLSDIGRSDTLAYAAALGLFEAVPTDEAEGAESIAAIASSYRLPITAFAPALDHLRGDIACGHASLLDTVLADDTVLSADRVHALVNLLHDLKHAYDQLHDGIIAYYEDISNYVPRLRVDYFSL